MRKPIVVGLTAPFQHGKTELQPVFVEAGWSFVDLNDFQNGLRLPGSERYDLYNQQVPGCLDDQGGETVEYYRHVTPEMRSLFIPGEVPYVAHGARELIAVLKPGDRVILSWELWPRILGRVPVDHMLVFMQPRDRWFQRLHRRIDERGWGDWIPDDAEITRLIGIMEAEPAHILHAVQHAMPQYHSVIDVSPDDWGVDELRAKLASLAQLAV